MANSGLRPKTLRMLATTSHDPNTRTQASLALSHRNERAAAIRQGRKSALLLRKHQALAASAKGRGTQAAANSAVHASGGGARADQLRSDFRRGFGSIKRQPAGRPNGGQFAPKG